MSKDVSGLRNMVLVAHVFLLVASTTQMGEMCPLYNPDVAHVGSIKIIIIKSK